MRVGHRVTKSHCAAGDLAARGHNPLLFATRLLKIVFDKISEALYRDVGAIENRFQYGGVMRTPVTLVPGQGDTDAVPGGLWRRPGTVVVEHRFDGHVVRRTTITLRNGELATADDALELAHGCVACTVRNDLLVLLRTLHRRDGVDRVVVHLAPWLEPEPICVPINHVHVRVGTGYPDGPAALDVTITGVVTCVDSRTWL